MRALVLGSTGFIGSRVCSKLAEAGIEVVCGAWTDAGADRLAAQGRSVLRADIRQPADASDWVRDVDAVINLAFADDDSAAVEVALAQALVSALAGTDKALVWTSGVGVVGPSGPAVSDEKAPLQLDGPFGWRAHGEALVLAAAADRVRSVVIRPPIVHADGEAAVLGLLAAAVQGGNAVPYPDAGDARWSTVHVEDLADLYVRALTSAQPGTVYIAASAHYVLIRELAEYASERLGLAGRTESLTLEELRARVGPMADLLAAPAAFSGALAGHDLGWHPEAPDLLSWRAGKG